MRFFRKNFTGGFTLIEFLVVISIIAILTAVATVSYTNVQKKSRDGKRKSDLAAIQQALAVYYQDTGHYPPYDAGPPVNEHVDWCTTISNPTYIADVYNKLASATPPTYIKQMPKDPIVGTAGGDGDYYYHKSAIGHYKLWAALENSNDPDISASSDTCNGDYSPDTLNYLVTDK